MALLYNPLQTVLITCREEVMILGKNVHKDNIITIDWHMPTSFEPGMYAISIGKTRFSHKLISKGKAFCVNFMPFELKEKVLYCGRHSGEHIDKFKEAGLAKEECENIDCPRIGEALGYIECEVIHEIDTGDHVIFIGRIAGAKELKTGKRIFHTEGDNFTTTR
jgi:flavin reductase (DIM6/NTAB) family NADH-FMN oxidoreductase RutF